MKPRLTVIAGRPVPILTQELRTESMGAVIRRWLYTLAEGAVAAVAVAAVMWFVATLILSLG